MRYQPKRDAVEVRPKPPVRRLSLRKKAIFSLVVVSACLGMLELAARVVEVWVPPRAVDFGQGFDLDSRLFEPSPGDPRMMRTRPEKLASFRLQEFAARKPPGTLRIVALGGSSVNYLDDEFRVLEGRLKEALSPRYRRVEVINGGGLSYGSARLARVAAEVLNDEPDLVLFYEAHNEFEEVEQLRLATNWATRPQQVASRLALMRVINDRVAVVRLAKLRREHEARVREQDLAKSAPGAARAWSHKFTIADVAARMEAFRANMTRIVQLCEAKGIPIVLATVPSNLVKPYLAKEAAEHYREVRELIDRGEFERAGVRGRQVLKECAGRHQSSDLENEIIRSIARERAVPLADVEAAVIRAEPHHLPGETLFMDHCHLNAEGNVILRATMEAEILKLFARPDGKP